MSDSRPTDCPFCGLPSERILAGNALALAVADAFPVSAGHALVISRRHVSSLFELTEAELAAVHELLRWMKDRLDESLKPGGYNVGVSVGAVAGQTVAHVHVHLIPRYAGDVGDRVGGVRNIIPGSARYPGAGPPAATVRGWHLLPPGSNSV
jgi:diadenosine tetraphosphate (Ap4A) HIT family hydrolase